MLMGAAMLWLKPKMVIEWGTHIGSSARVFHELNTHYKINAEIHSIDLPESVKHAEHPHRRRGMLVRNLPVQLHEGDGPSVAVTLMQEKGCQTPLVFIDGDHELKSVLRDAQMIAKVAPHAALLFHDTFYQPSSSYNHGPYMAIQELLQMREGSFQVVEAGMGCPGMTLLLPA